MLGCIVFKKVAGGKNTIKRWWQVHRKEKKKSDTWSLKNTSVLSILSFYSGPVSRNRKTWSGIFESMKELLNRSPPPIRTERFLWPRNLSRSLLLDRLLSNLLTDPFKKAFVCYRLLHQSRELSWLTFCYRSHGLLPTSLVVGYGPHIPTYLYRKYYWRKTIFLSPPGFVQK